jgi:tricarboxylate carrier
LFPSQDACVHPDTGEVIFAPFRFSAFVPTNIPLVVGMLSATSPGATMFWQWANQSYNVAVNYSNRNIGASTSMSNSAIMASYAGAVVASCSLSVGLGALVSKMNTSASPSLGLRLLRGAVPFVAVASAGVVNVALMRRQEAINGIGVKDHEGVERGISITAGKQAVTEVALTRVALPAPILLFPPAIMSLWDRTGLAKANPKWRPFVQVPVITACLWLALPLAIGLFPQVSSVKAEQLEPQFHNLKDSKGNRVEQFFFNKGL